MIDRRFRGSARPALVAAAIALLATVAFVATSCAGAAGTSPSQSPSPSTTTARQTSGIRGIVLRVGGPYASPSPLPGGLGVSQGRPYPHVIVQVTMETDTGSSRAVVRLESDGHGLFTVALPPGTYELEALPREGAGPRSLAGPQPTWVVAEPGAFARAIVDVDSGV